MPKTQLQVGIPGGDQRIPIPEHYQDQPPQEWIPVHGVDGCWLHLRLETAGLDEVVYDWVGPAEPAAERVWITRRSPGSASRPG